MEYLEKEAVLQTVTNILNLHCVEEDSDTWKYAEDLIKAFESAEIINLIEANETR